MLDVVFVADILGNSIKYVLECFFFIIWNIIKITLFLSINISKYLYGKIITIYRNISNGYKNIKKIYENLNLLCQLDLDFSQKDTKEEISPDETNVIQDHGKITVDKRFSFK